MEMNTRLQVEHPVTEAVTGFDLVEWQFRVAAGEPLPVAQDQVPLGGHAIEGRIYAEDPERTFLPSTGQIRALVLPDGEGIRVDAGVAAGDQVTPFYDPMIAKVIAHAPTRTEAIDRLAGALDRTVVAGVRSNTGFLATLLRAEEFRAGRHDTGFIERHLDVLAAAPKGPDRAAIAAGAAHLLARERARVAGEAVEAEPSPWDAGDAFQLSGPRETMLPLDADGHAATATVSWRTGAAVVTVEGEAAASDARAIDGDDAVYVLRRGRQTVVRLRTLDPLDAAHLGEGGVVAAPMHGKVIEILVAPGEAVKKGQRLAVIEAMKMEHALASPIDGTVADLRASVGGQVAEGAVVMTITPA
jgi:3-methylcrotonyl-CoA carboxylase alpha subunit